MRLRFKLFVHGRQEKLLLVEEAGMLAFTGMRTHLPTSEMRRLNYFVHLQPKIWLPLLRNASFGRLLHVSKKCEERAVNAAYAAQRAKILLADHERVRSATASMPGAPRVTVEPVLLRMSWVCMCLFREASRMARVRKSTLSFDAITLEGSLLSSAKFAAVAERKAEEQNDTDYSIPKGLTLRDETARYFRIGQALFRIFMPQIPCTSQNDRVHGAASSRSLRLFRHSGCQDSEVPRRQDFR